MALRRSYGYVLCSGFFVTFYDDRMRTAPWQELSLRLDGVIVRLLRERRDWGWSRKRRDSTVLLRRFLEA